MRPLDSPFSKSGTVPGIQGQFSATRSFTYQPVNVTNLSPHSGQTVVVPTLSWNAVIGADLYEVEVWNRTGGRVDTATTRSTSYTVKGRDRLDPTGGPFTWKIRAVTAAGEESVLYSRAFNVSGNMPTTGAVPLTPLSPTPSTVGIQGAPRMTWKPMPGAAYYTVRVGKAMDGQQTWYAAETGGLFTRPVPYPAMTDTGRQLFRPGSYDWEVTAYDSEGGELGTGSEGRFTVEPIATITGHRVAPDGREVQDGTPCTTTSGSCTVPSTPTLAWTPDPRVSFYVVYVSRAASFTNLLEEHLLASDRQEAQLRRRGVLEQRVRRDCQ